MTVFNFVMQALLAISFILYFLRCGIAMDTWMFPLAKDIHTHGIHQPLTFINSFKFQWARNVASMMKLVKPPSETG